MVSYNYTIRRCGSGPVSGSEEINDGNNARSFTLTGLEEDSDYTITLTAISAAGQLTSNQTTINTYSFLVTLQILQGRGGGGGGGGFKEDTMKPLYLSVSSIISAKWFS